MAAGDSVVLPVNRQNGRVGVASSADPDDGHARRAVGANRRQMRERPAADQRLRALRQSHRVALRRETYQRAVAIVGKSEAMLGEEIGLSDREDRSHATQYRE